MTAAHGAVDTVRTTRTVVVGSGIAGLTAALHLGDCTVLTKSALGEGASRWAQGGLAAALGGDDHPGLHAADTVVVSGGLGDLAIADLVAAAAPSRIRWLRHLGAAFDTDEDGDLTFGREAGHQRRRIVHADGDATGREVMRTLVAAVRDRADIELIEHTAAVDLIRAKGGVVGVLAMGPDGQRLALVTPAVVLATGGIGRVYSSTTNPREATGDGLAMAIRAGAAIRDPEFVQFHPTALESALDPKPLLTEALRGEGAHLVDATGRRYMVDLHPDAELAPRDEVARANWRELRSGPVFLDARSIGHTFPERFPTAFGHARNAGLDPRVDLLPVVPAQHYHMGGVLTDAAGRTSLGGLYACGEVASTGLHGANRLASNSLVEGLVFGTRVAEAIMAVPGGPARSELVVPAGGWPMAPEPHEVTDLREVMWNNGGLVRTESGLRQTLTVIDELAPALADHTTGRNLCALARVVVGAALERRESRGAHFRADHPQLDPAQARHTVVYPQPTPVASLDLPNSIPAMAGASA